MAHPAQSARWTELTRVPLAVDQVRASGPVPAPPDGEHVRLVTKWGQMRLHLRETPSDAPGRAVLLHGLAGSSTNWADLSRLLVPHLSSTALDLPGFGLSEPVEGFSFSPREHAHVVIRYLDEHTDEPVHLAGNSFGGAVAVEVAASRPDLVASLTLISPAVPDLRPDPRRLSDPRLGLTVLPLIGPRIRRRLAGMTPEERAQRLLHLCFADPSLVPPHRLAQVAEEIRQVAALPWSGTAEERTLVQLLRHWLAPPNQSLWSLLQRVPVRSLVIWGEADRVVSVRKAVRTARALPRGKLLVLPRTGHVAQIERPRIVAAAMIGMIKEDTW